jgi:predicted dehydrogenase
MTILKAAIVGCGAIGSLYDEGRLGLDPRSHAGAYRQHPETWLVAGADIDAARRERFTKMWGVPAYADYSEMLAREHPDIVSVCTQPDSHAEVTIASVNAGARLIFCEKPLSDSLSNGVYLVEACEKREVTLAVNHMRRWDKAHRQVRDFVGSGELGEVQHAISNYARGVANYGSHIGDLLRFFFGEVDWVRAFNLLDEQNADPVLDAYVKMRDGVSCALVGCSRENYDIFDFDIIGTRGRIRIEDLGYRIRLWRMGTHSQIPDRKVLIEAFPPFSPSMHGMMLAAVDNLVRCVTEGQKPLNTGRDGLAALEIIEALKRSATANGERVNLPLESNRLER